MKWLIGCLCWVGFTLLVARFCGFNKIREEDDYDSGNSAN